MKHTAQSGRTIVETLGALAVMGVLSVGGLHAFSSIMDRFRANDLLEGASARAMRVSEQIKKGRKTLSLGKFSHNETSGGTFSKQVITEGLSKQFGIQVSNVKKAVCERLLDSITDTSPLRRLSLATSPTTPFTECQDDNAFLMIYNGGIKGKNKDTDYHCESDMDCNTVCATCNEQGYCNGECKIPSPDIDAFPGEECGENECIIYDEETQTCKMACERVEYLEATGTQWISTGINITTTDSFDAQYVVSLVLKASRGLMGYSAVNHGYWGINMNSQYELGGNTTLIDVSEKDSVLFKRRIDNSGKQTQELHVNGTLAKTLTRASGETGAYSLWAIGNGGWRTSGKIYSFKMHLNGENIFDFVPVLAPDETPCMFDRISQKLFCNSGTGTFKTNLDE